MLKSMYKSIQRISQLLHPSAVGITVLFLSGCATLGLERSGYNWGDFLKDTDSNGSQSVELDEFDDYLTRQGGQSENVPDSFSDMDLDGNGSIDESEFVARGSITEVSQVQSWPSFSSLADRNDDGNVNYTEWVNAPRKQANAPKREEFNKYDINGDGEVTLDEYNIASKQ